VRKLQIGDNVTYTGDLFYNLIGFIGVVKEARDEMNIRVFVKQVESQASDKCWGILAGNLRLVAEYNNSRFIDEYVVKDL
jgi:hypothetical protein